MADYEDFTVPFTLMPKADLDIEKLRQVADEADEWMGGFDPEQERPWSYKQCLVIILHNRPERLHEFLQGWTVDTPWQQLADVDD